MWRNPVGDGGKRVRMGEVCHTSYHLLCSIKQRQIISNNSVRNFHGERDLLLWSIAFTHGDICDDIDDVHSLRHISKDGVFGV